MQERSKTFIIATTGDRFDGLKRLVISLFPFFKTGWTAVIVAQSYSDKDLSEIKRLTGKNADIIKKNYLIGAHSAKMIALNYTKSEIWCSLDDDMIATQSTDYDQVADILRCNKNIGFISGNWARTQKQANAKKVVNELVPQKLVYTGGGLLFREDVAEIIRNIPNEQYLFDDCLWAMYAYINGYSNYRFRGSIAVHQICTVGGRKSWLKERKDRVLPPNEFLKVRKSKDSEGYFICNDRDLTDLAKELHERNKK